MIAHLGEMIVFIHSRRLRRRAYMYIRRLTRVRTCLFQRIIFATSRWCVSRNSRRRKNSFMSSPRVWQKIVMWIKHAVYPYSEERSQVVKTPRRMLRKWFSMDADRKLLQLYSESFRVCPECFAVQCKQIISLINLFFEKQIETILTLNLWMKIMGQR